MPLTNSTTQANIAFKNLLGKSITDVGADILGELNGISFNILSNNIWLNQISSSPTTAVGAGYAVKVTASMVLIDGSNNHAYNAIWPTLAPTGTDYLTNAAYVYNTGALTGITAGSPIKNAISDSYGQSYKILVYDNTLSQIVPLDSRNWVYQYNSGIFFQETYKTPVPAFSSLYVYVGSTLYNQPNTPYTNASASEVTLGGLPTTSFSSVSFNNVLDSVLYPSLQANITNFQIQGVETSYEVGNGIINTSGPYTISWTLSNTSNLTSNQLYVISHTGSYVYGPTSNTSPIIGYTVSNTTLLLSTTGSYTWKLSVLRTNGERIYSNYVSNWYYGIYYGASTQSGVTNSFHTKLISTPLLSNSVSGNYTFPSGGTTSYKYITVPDSLTSIKLISWKGMPVVMADSTDGFTSSLNDINYNLVSFTNQYGVTSNYKIYRTKNMLTATMSNIIIS